MSKRGAPHLLPVLAPVVEYEKIKRIGEGTYGVVCMGPPVLQLCKETLPSTCSGMH